MTDALTQSVAEALVTGDDAFDQLPSELQERLLTKAARVVEAVRFSLPDEIDRAERLRSLWTPTPPELIAKLPRGQNKEGPSSACNVCHGWHRSGGVHLDYLGHSDTTRIIAAVDLFWQWAPKAGWDSETGEPRMVRDDNGYPIRLWIDLTILGITRPGVGTVERGKGDPEKELIGDAIRNAAMRFGIGADLWSKAFRSGSGELDSTGTIPASSRYTTRDAAQGNDTPALTPDQVAQQQGWVDLADQTKNARLLAQLVAGGPATLGARWAAWRAACVEAWGVNWARLDSWAYAVDGAVWLAEHPDGTAEEAMAALRTRSRLPATPELRQKFLGWAAGHMTEPPPTEASPTDQPPTEAEAEMPGAAPELVEQVTTEVLALAPKDLDAGLRAHQLPVSGSVETRRQRLVKEMVRARVKASAAERSLEAARRVAGVKGADEVTEEEHQAQLALEAEAAQAEEARQRAEVEEPF
jgi:hypothetical protein